MLFLKKEKEILVYVNDVYLYYHNICPLLIFSVTLLRSLKSFKKQKRKCNTAFVSFFFPLMLVVFLNIQIFKISNFPTLDHIFKIFQETNISKKVFRKKLDKLFPNKHHHIHDQARNQYLVQQRGAFLKRYVEHKACL